MKILITGGFGNLGSRLAEYFYRKNYKVTVLSNSDDRKLPGIKYNFIKADITKSEELDASITECFDCCIHTASLNDSFITGYAEKALMVNALGTRNIIKTLLDKDVKRFVYFSTFHVYGVSEGSIDENTPLSPKNDYATTHLFGEYYANQFWRTHRFPYTILRLTNCYGAPRYPNSTKWYLALNDMARSAIEKEEIVLNSNGLGCRDFIWIGDVCSIVDGILTADKTTGETFNVASGRTYKIMDIANIVKIAYEERYGRKINIKTNEADHAVYGESLHVSNKKLKSVVNFEIHDKIYDEVNNIFDIMEQSRYSL